MRAFFVAVSAVLLVVVGSLLPVLWPGPSPVTRAASDRIRVGMKQAEVQAILGGHPGDYTTQPVLVFHPYGGGVLMGPGHLRQWWGDEGVVQVRIDEGGTVLWKRFVPAATADMEPDELLLWRLGRLKERFLDPLEK
jgi:hypothetical protein